MNFDKKKQISQLVTKQRWRSASKNSMATGLGALGVGLGASLFGALIIWLSRSLSTPTGAGWILEVMGMIGAFFVFGGVCSFFYGIIRALISFPQYLGSIGYDKMVAELLGNADVIEATEPLLREYIIQQENRRSSSNIQAALALFRIIGGPRSEDIHCRVLDDSSYPKKARVSVVNSIRESETIWGEALLIKTLKDPDSDLRICSAQALGHFRSLNAVPVLIDALDSLNDNKVVVAVVEALGKIGDTRAVEPLIKILKHNENPGNIEIVVFEAAAKSLGEIGDIRAVDPLINVINPCWNEKTNKLRNIAVDSIGLIGDPRSASILSELKSKALREENVARGSYDGTVTTGGFIEAVDRALHRLDEKA